MRISTALVALVCAASALADAETLRIATWNVSNYRGGREADLANALFGSYQGRSMSPDVLMAQEVQSAAAATAFLNVLKQSNANWAASYTSLTGTSATNDQVVFYRADKVSVLGAPTLIKAAAGTSSNPRDVYRWDFNLLRDRTSEILSFYDVHLKSGDYNDRDQAGGPTNAQRRQDATDAIRADANSLDANHHAVVGGDFNVQRASESDYQALVGDQANDRGRFFDPISSAGVWNNNSAYRYIHTQDPSGSGGMDDRHDQILLDHSLVDGTGLDYVGAFGTAYSTTTWDDPNHSYRVWGNDGTSFNSSLTIAGNAMVGSSIAQSLVNAATTAGGHLPVYLDLRYEAVPEPASMVALGVGIAALLRRRRPVK